MPTTISIFRLIITAISSCSSAMLFYIREIERLFTAAGIVIPIIAAPFNTCAALYSRTPAFFALFVNSLFGGAVTLGPNLDYSRIDYKGSGNINARWQAA